MGSRLHVQEIQGGPPLPYEDDIRAFRKEYAELLDAQDPLRRFRDEFIIPSKKDLKRKTLFPNDGMYVRLCVDAPFASLIQAVSASMLQKLKRHLMKNVFIFAATRLAFNPVAPGNTSNTTFGHGQPRA
jgi:hypothetical protein